MIDKSIGERIREVRESLGLSQEALGDVIGMSHGQVSKFELDRFQPSQGFLNAMMIRFGTNPDWILTGQGDIYITAKDYIDKGIELFGAQKMSEGFLSALQDSHFAELQSFITMDKVNTERNDDELQEVLQQVAKLWHLEDERVRKALTQWVKAFVEGGNQ
jgi:transcriptional regulator with XRE-family HTH domain